MSKTVFISIMERNIKCKTFQSFKNKDENWCFIFTPKFVIFNTCILLYIKIVDCIKYIFFDIKKKIQVRSNMLNISTALSLRDK